MIGALMGLPGKVKTLLDRLTATRAGYLDNLDAVVSTRAAASTALTNVTWTDAKSNKLTNAAQEDSPLLDIPIASGLVATTVRALYHALTGACGVEYTAIGNGTTTVTYTGAGVLEFIAIQNAQSVTNNVTSMSIVIDGVTVWSLSTLSYSANVFTVVPIGAATPQSYYNAGVVYQPPAISLGSVPFKASFTVTATGAIVSAGNIFYKYRKTA